MIKVHLSTKTQHSKITKKGSGVRDMKITIKRSQKKIAALVVAIQERTVLSDNLIVERDSLITVPEGICEPKFQNKS